MLKKILNHIFHIVAIDKMSTNMTDVRSSNILSYGVTWQIPNKYLLSRIMQDCNFLN